ncbi:ABC-F family ATP-binding cassette domain-containing protein [Microbaculum marinisediminis]|uniref:ABC-F family ATP-binding cassette domain-containing protein n=1 Tax=Microbaculum marinisediminis TaxID=2931392 RepID=A0AAW5R095_9HYPH|nr:ABC-F family ATP-binding cassette domain-containing protein [Microbaculum sp. A6E488]MCT8973224.1 ABC-F family ATP-binding cassette domain-containing protein [Microbaculum sp. A6E488]
MLQITDLTYRIAGRTLLNGATVTLPTGARAGLVGRNGTGKTTLFRLIKGEAVVESGSVGFPAKARIGTVEQEAPAGPTSLIDFVLSADTERARLMAEADSTQDGARIGEIHARLSEIDAYSAESRAARILSGLGFDQAAQQRPLESFSGGWRMRVALAAVLFTEPDLLLLDEPTNYLDLEGTLWLESYLARYPHTMIVISHDRDLLNTAVDTIVHLDQGKLTVYRGTYDQFERQRREKQALAEKSRKKQDEQRKHMQAFVDRFRYKASKARQAQSRLKALAKMEPIEALVDGTFRPFHFPSPEKPLASPIIQLDSAAVGYGGKPVLRNLNLRLDHDDRIGLLGSNGNGKSTLAKLLSGRLQSCDGRMHAADRLTVGFFAQHQLDELSADLSPTEQVRRLMPDAKEAEVRSKAAQLGFGIEKADIPASKLSGGEKARLLLGLATFFGPHLLILDEPTNHLDVDAREALVQALAEYEGAVIVISHDRHLIETTVDRLWLVAGGTVVPFDGDMEDYRKRVLSGDDSIPETAETITITANRGDQRRAAAQKRAELQPLRNRQKDAEKRMATLQSKIADLDGRLADPDLFTRDPAKGADLSRERARTVEALAAAEEDWLEAGAALEGATG